MVVSTLALLSFRDAQGYIDLSKRRVSPEDVAKCEDRYNKAKAVHSVLRHVADLRGLVLEDLSTKVSWPLYKKYGHAFDAFKLTLQDEEDVFVGLDIDEETKQAMITHIKRRLAPQPSKVGFGFPLVYVFRHMFVGSAQHSILQHKLYRPLFPSKRYLVAEQCCCRQHMLYLPLFPSKR